MSQKPSEKENGIFTLFDDHRDPRLKVRNPELWPSQKNIQKTLTIKYANAILNISRDA